MRDVTDLAIERARAHGIAGIALRNSSHAGRIADFCARGARGGVAILFWFNDSGGGQDVAPYGGDAARLATNPIGAGIPRASEPHLVLDMSTSVIARGRLDGVARPRRADRSGTGSRPGGAIRPSGGYKGTGLALVAEALAGILTGSGSVSASPRVRRAGRLLHRDRHRPPAAAGRVHRRDGADARLRARRAARAGARRRPLPRRVGRRGRGRAAPRRRARAAVHVGPARALAAELGVPLPQRLS